MRGLKLTLAWCFAGVALLLIWVAVVFLRVPIHVDPEAPPSVINSNAMLVAMDLAVSALFALAWWTILRRKISARTWAIAASLVPLVISLASLRFQPLTIQNPAWLPFILGVAGLAVFARREAIAGPAHPVYKSLPGDGTNKFVNKKLTTLAAALATIGSITLLSHWGDAHGLPPNVPPVFYLQILINVLLLTAIHEAGHAVAGIALRMKLTAFIIGPLQWCTTDGKWTFKFSPAGLVSFMGVTRVVPLDLEDFRRRKILQVAAGPFASIATGLIAMVAILMAPGRPWAADWRMLVIFATTSMIVGVFNLVPFGIKCGYSDGAKLYQLFCAGLWADYQLLLGVINSIAVTPQRPRDYNIETIQRAAGTIAIGLDEMFLYLCESSCFLDRGQHTEAANAFFKAGQLCRESALSPPEEWYGALVFGIAYFHKDASTARQWWDQLEAAKSFRPDKEWSSKCALLWSEDRLEEATEAWIKADAWACQLPHTGLGEVERSVVALLRHALDESRSIDPTQTLPTPTHQFIALEKVPA